MDEYFRNSLERDSEEMNRIRCAVKEAGIFCVLGYSERYQGSLYISQVRKCPLPYGFLFLFLSFFFFFPKRPTSLWYMIQVIH